MTIIKGNSRFTSYIGDTFQINFDLNGLQTETIYNAHFTIKSKPVIEYEQKITSDSDGAASVSFFIEKSKTKTIKTGIYSLGLKLCTGVYSDTVYSSNIQFLTKVAGEGCND